MFINKTVITELKKSMKNKKEKYTLFLDVDGYSMFCPIATEHVLGKIREVML